MAFQNLAQLGIFYEARLPTTSTECVWQQSLDIEPRCMSTLALVMLNAGHRDRSGSDWLGSTWPERVTDSKQITNVVTYALCKGTPPSSSTLSAGHRCLDRHEWDGQRGLGFILSWWEKMPRCAATSWNIKVSLFFSVQLSTIRKQEGADIHMCDNIAFQ